MSITESRTAGLDASAGDADEPTWTGLEAARVPLRELLDDRLLERSKDAAGGLRLTGAG